MPGVAQKTLDLTQSLARPVRGGAVPAWRYGAYPQDSAYRADSTGRTARARDHELVINVSLSGACVMGITGLRCECPGAIPSQGASANHSQVFDNQETNMNFTVKLWADESVDVEVDGDVISIDGEVCADGMLTHLLQFGVRQCIRDAAASETQDAERNVLARKKIQAIQDGTLRIGTGGGARKSELDVAMEAVAMRALRKKYPNETQKALKGAVEAAIKGNFDKIKAQAEQDLASARDLDVEVTI